MTVKVRYSGIHVTAIMKAAIYSIAPTCTVCNTLRCYTRLTFVMKLLTVDTTCTGLCPTVEQIMPKLESVKICRNCSPKPCYLILTLSKCCNLSLLSQYGQSYLPVCLPLPSFFSFFLTNSPSSKRRWFRAPLELDTKPRWCPGNKSCLRLDPCNKRTVVVP